MNCDFKLEVVCRWSSDDKWQATASKADFFRKAKIILEVY